jgi:hypothetical protein
MKVKVEPSFQKKRKLCFGTEQNSVKFSEEKEGPHGIQGVSFGKKKKKKKDSATVIRSKMNCSRETQQHATSVSCLSIFGSRVKV